MSQNGIRLPVLTQGMPSVCGLTDMRRLPLEPLPCGGRAARRAGGSRDASTCGSSSRDAMQNCWRARTASPRCSAERPAPEPESLSSGVTSWREHRGLSLPADEAAPVLWPETIELSVGHDRGPMPAFPLLEEEEEEEDTATADMAKSRWLSDKDREASGNSPEQVAPGGWASQILQPANSVARLRAKMAHREQRTAGRTADPLYGVSGLAASGTQILRKAERRGIGRDSEVLAPKAAVPRLPEPVLALALGLGCAAAVVVAYQSRGRASTSATRQAGQVATQVLGHVAVEEAPEEDLAPVLADGSVLMRKAAAKAFLAMQAEARGAGVYLLPLSGFRSVKDQQAVFYGVKAARNQNIRDRAKVSAPPGFSEHHTGYALDIGDASEPRTHLEFDFENTEAFHWLQSNANRFHFELSFPPNNDQGIMYEPWHWRFVGNRHATMTFYGSLHPGNEWPLP